MTDARTSRSRLLTGLNVLLLAAGLVVAALWLRATGGMQAFAALSELRWWGIPLLVGASTASIGMRFVRWQYLLRRADVRIPARRSLSIYLASLMGIATPGYVGEIVRGVFLKRGFGVPLRSTVSVIVFERLLDVAALVLIGLVTTDDGSTRLLLVVFLFGAVAFGAAALGVGRAAGVPDRLCRRLISPAALAKSMLMSLVVWGFASLLVNLAAASVGESLGLLVGAEIFSTSTLFGGVTLMPAGVGATGTAAIVQLSEQGLTLDVGVVIVTVVRLASVGLWLSVAAFFLVREVRAFRNREVSGSTEHFNEVAQEYDEQFSEHVWNHLIARKMDMLADALGDRGKLGSGRRGLDLGCGLGQQTRAMRERGFDVIGIDAAHGLVKRAHEDGQPVLTASALQLPFADESLDFVFVVGVLHHLPDTTAQLAAVAEVHRVLRPGGRLLVHETNPRNLLFSFYMGYVFPLLKTIDEGTEWWISPESWEQGGALRHVETRYFTFLPDFIPSFLMPPFKVLERVLERSRLHRYSVHYMAVLEK